MRSLTIIFNVNRVPFALFCSAVLQFICINEQVYEISNNVAF